MPSPRPMCSTERTRTVRARATPVATTCTTIGVSIKSKYRLRSLLSTSKTVRRCRPGVVPIALFSLSTQARAPKDGRAHTTSHRAKSISVNTTYNYIHYSMSSVVGSSTNANLIADDVASNGTGSSILNINDLG